MRPPLAMTKPTEVPLGAGRRVVVAPDKGGVAQALTERLRALGVEVLGVEEASSGEVHGVYWLPALDDEGSLEEMKIGSIETVEIDQGIWGRILGFGDIKVTGRGISDVLFRRMADPMDVKRRIEGVSHPAA